MNEIRNIGSILNTLETRNIAEIPNNSRESLTTAVCLMHCLDQNYTDWDSVTIYGKEFILRK